MILTEGRLSYFSTLVFSYSKNVFVSLSYPMQAEHILITCGTCILHDTRDLSRSLSYHSMTAYNP